MTISYKAMKNKNCILLTMKDLLVNQKLRKIIQKCIKKNYLKSFKVTGTNKKGIESNGTIAFYFRER